VDKLQIETTVTLHFLISGFNILMETDGRANILESLALGEDSFAYQCCEIAEAIEILNSSVEQDRGCPGVYHYEAIEDIASQVLFDYVDKQGSVPLVLEFIRRFKPLLEKWYEGEGN